MSSNNDELSEEQKRRKRINLYKKIIVITIIVIILLPTLLSIILFCKINSLSREINNLKAVVYNGYESNTTGITSVAEIETEPITENEKATETEKESETEEPTKATVKRDETTAIAYAHEKATTEPVETLSYKEQYDKAVKEGKKIVYLTYDDGPCKNTDRLLKVLEKYNVKVTFFVICNDVYRDSLKKIVADGHTLAMHTYSHDYTRVYSNLNNFKEEVTSLRAYLKEVTGYDAFIFRFPGGSSNTMTTVPISTYINYLNSENIVYYDWNVSSGDGGGTELTVEEVYNNVIDGVMKNDISVVLLHDSEYRESTLKATPLIIEKLQEMGAVILPITEDTVPIHHNIN